MFTHVSERGEPVVIKVPCYYSPNIELHLFSPQDYTCYHKMSPHSISMMGSQNWFGFQLCDNVDGDVRMIHSNINPQISAILFLHQEFAPVHSVVHITNMCRGSQGALLEFYLMVGSS